jgi:HSP20 family protein
MIRRTAAHRKIEDGSDASPHARGHEAAVSGAPGRRGLPAAGRPARRRPPGAGARRAGGADRVSARSRGVADGRAGGRGPAAAFRPALEIRGEEKRYVVNLEVPGIDEKDLRIEIRDNELTISGEKKCECEAGDKDAAGGNENRYSERAYGAFTRTLSLPDDVNADAVAAGHKNGVLTLTLPRKEPEKAEGKVISISKE